MMKIYTKTGDLGETGLLGGVRVSKASERVEAYGAVDELVSLFGVIRSMTKDSSLQEILGRTQLELFFLSSELATPESKKVSGEVLEEDAVEMLEADIDTCDLEMPPLRSFILPGGDVVASQLQFARTVCRRAERALVHLQASSKIRPVLVRYLNRLSDQLFALGRLMNHRAGIEEVQVSELRKSREEQKNRTISLKKAK